MGGGAWPRLPSGCGSWSRLVDIAVNPGRRKVAPDEPGPVGDKTLGEIAARAAGVIGKLYIGGSRAAAARNFFQNVLDRGAGYAAQWKARNNGPDWQPVSQQAGQAGGVSVDDFYPRKMLAQMVNHGLGTLDQHEILGPDPAFQKSPGDGSEAWPKLDNSSGAGWDKTGHMSCQEGRAGEHGADTAGIPEELPCKVPESWTMLPWFHVVSIPCGAVCLPGSGPILETFLPGPVPLFPT